MSDDGKAQTAPSAASVLLEQAGGRRLVKELAGAAELALRIRGDCMEPVLREGERVTVKARRLYLPGDLVVVRGAAGLLVHRCLGYRPRRSGWEIWTRADRATGADPAVPLADVLGRVVGRPVPTWARLLAGARFVATALGGLGRCLARRAGVAR